MNPQYVKNSYNSIIYENQQYNLKKNKRFEQTLHQRRDEDDEQAHEKLLNVISHQGNANKTTVRYYYMQLLEWLKFF